MGTSIKTNFDSKALKSTFETKNSLTPKVREQVCDALNQILADLSDLYSQTKQAHWNVRGPLFIALHKLFDELAETVELHIDPLAERITALGGTALGTVRMASQYTSLEEFPTHGHDDTIFLPALIERYGACTNSIRKQIDATADLGDMGSSDLLTGIVRDLDKGLWLLEAHRRE